MSVYRLLQDHYINGNYLSAGSTQSTADVGGLLPFGWSPTPSVDPLDTPAVNAFYAAGPAQLLIFEFGALSYQVKPPKTYWRSTPIAGSPFLSWQLTGLGSSLSPICA